MPAIGFMARGTQLMEPRIGQFSRVLWNQIPELGNDESQGFFCSVFFFYYILKKT